MTNESKKLTSSLKCRHCGNTAPMEIVFSYKNIKEQLVVPEEGPVFYKGEIIEIIRCFSCKNISLRLQPFDEFYEEIYEVERPEPQIVYPSGPSQVIGLPPKVAKAYEAAMKVQYVDPNAFAVLLGRVLEEVCRDQGAEGASLYEKLKDLASKGKIPDRIAEMAHALRQLRNVGAHADLGELSGEEIPFLHDLIRVILEYVYSIPKLVERVQNRLDKLKSRQH